MTAPSHGGNGGAAPAAGGQGAPGGRDQPGGRGGSSQGGSGLPASGGTTASGGQTAGGGRAAGGSGGEAGGAGGQGAVRGATGGRSVPTGGLGGAVASSGGAGGNPAGQGGAPSVACNAVTCPTGCCDGNRCVSAPTAQQCGLAGAACQACGACQRCSTSGACEVDPDSRWQMIAVSATLAPLYSDGSAWDGPRDLYGGALPDPFVQFELPVDNALGWTDTLVDTLTPMWNQAVIPASAAVRAGDLLPGGRAWVLWVGDEDSDNYADLMCEITGPLSPADFAAGGFGRTGVGGCLTLSMRLVCAM